MVYTEGNAKMKIPGGFQFLFTKNYTDNQDLIQKIYTENWMKSGVSIQYVNMI